MNKILETGTDNNQAQQKEDQLVTEDSEKDNREEIRSIIFSFTIVSLFFSAIFILKHFEKLTLDNIAISLLIAFSIGVFWASHQKKDTNEIIEFKEPKI